MSSKAKEQINLDAGGRETDNSKSISSFFRGIILFTLVWWVAIIFIYLNVRCCAVSSVQLVTRRLLSIHSAHLSSWQRKITH